MKKTKIPSIDKKNFPYDLAMVYWEDIVGDVAWADIPDIKKSKTAICCSVGWIVHNNKTTVVMADFIFEDNGKIKQGGGYTTIPTKNVLSIKKIKLQETIMARKKKTRTISDVIEDIRELHEKEEDLLMELEDLSEESDIGKADDGT